MGTELSGNHIKIIPIIFQSLLIQFPRAVYIDIGHYFKHSKKANDTVIEGLLESIELEGRIEIRRTGNKASDHYSLLGFTRRGFVQWIQPRLDCLHGLSSAECGDVLGNLKETSERASKANKRHALTLVRNPKVSKSAGSSSKHAKHAWLHETFVFLSDDHKGRLGRWVKPRVCLGILPEHLESILKRVNIESATKYGILLYVEGVLSTLQIQKLVTADSKDHLGSLSSLIVVKHYANRKNSDINIPPAPLPDDQGEWDEFMLDIIQMEASEDKCDRFIRIRSPEDAILEGANWINKLVQFGSVVPVRSAFLILTGGTDAKVKSTSIQVLDDDTFLRIGQLVGSIHNAIDEGIIGAGETVKIFIASASPLSLIQRQVMRMWRHVEVWDRPFEKLFVFDTPTPFNQTAPSARPSAPSLTSTVDWGKEAVRLVMMERILQEAFVDSVILLDDKIAFGMPQKIGTLLKVLWKEQVVLVDGWSKGENAVIEGYTAAAFARFHGQRLSRMRGMPIEQTSKSNQSSIFKIPPPPEDLLKYPRGTPELYDLDDLRSSQPQHYCHLLMRTDVHGNMVALGLASLLNTWPTLEMEDRYNLGKEQQKERIGILVPVYHKSSAFDLLDTSISLSKVSPLLHTFLPSLLQTVRPEEWTHYQLILYIGYDEGDPVADKRQVELLEHITDIYGDRDVIVKMVRLPTVKWVSYLWTQLYVQAMADGCEYAYQVNDDLKFGGAAGWITAWTGHLRSHQGIGVAGPSDDKWKCRLLTQSFVSRRHGEIFAGIDGAITYFPMGIRDWYTDNWITNVYPSKFVYCSHDYTIQNSNVPTRYTACERPKWERHLAEGKAQLEAYLKNNKIEL